MIDCVCVVYPDGERVWEHFATWTNALGEKIQEPPPDGCFIERPRIEKHAPIVATVPLRGERIHREKSVFDSSTAFGRELEKEMKRHGPKR